MIKRIFLDTETTGLDPKRHGLFNIAGIIVYGTIYEEFDLFCDIYAEDVYDPDSMRKYGYTNTEIKKFPDPFDTYKKLMEILQRHVDRYDRTDKFHIHGYFVNFDYEFLRQWFLNNGDQYFGSYFWHPPIDVAVIAAYYLMLLEKRQNLTNFQLATVANYMGIETEDCKTHSGLYDAKLAMEIYNVCAGAGRKVEVRVDDVPF